LTHNKSLQRQVLPGNQLHWFSADNQTTTKWQTKI